LVVAGQSDGASIFLTPIKIIPAIKYQVSEFNLPMKGLLSLSVGDFMYGQI